MQLPYLKLYAFLFSDLDRIQTSLISIIISVFYEYKCYYTKRKATINPKLDRNDLTTISIYNYNKYF